MKFKRLKSKRGAVLVNAILFMMVIFSLCTLLTTLITLSHYQVKLDGIYITRRAELDQIGEDFLAYVENTDENKTFNNTNEKYSCAVEGNTLTVWAASDEDKASALLYVEAELTDGIAAAVVWRYSSPSADSVPEATPESTAESTPDTTPETTPESAAESTN